MHANEPGADTQGQSDRILVEAAKENPDAFERIFCKYHDRIFNYVLRRTCSATLTQDITANTFLQALRHIKRFRWKGISLSSWLFRIATNEINQNYRKARRFVPLTAELMKSLRTDNAPDSALLDIEESILQDEKFKKVCSVLSGIRLKYQTVLTLRYFEEKSVKEIAEIVGVSENTVKTRIRRGLIQLRAQL